MPLSSQQSLTAQAPPPYEESTSSSQLAPPPQPLAVSTLLEPTASQPTANRVVTHTASSNHLHKIVAIPATTPKLGSPFLRAYPPTLSHFRISRDLFLKFLDDLNRVAVQSPPLQVLNLAGTIVGFVPLQTTQIVGGALNAAAGIGTVAVSKGRTELFLRDANRTIFAPRGLKVEIAKIEAMAKIAGMPILNTEGKLDKNASLLAPIEDQDASSAVTGQERRLQALEPYIAHLDLTPLPEIDVPENPLSKWSASVSERNRRKGEGKMLESRNEAHSKYYKESEKLEKEYAKDMKKVDREEEKVRTKEKDASKREKELKKVAKEREKLEREYAKETQKIDKDRRKDDKEESAMRKILWLVVRNLEDDSGPGGNPDLPDITEAE